MGNPNFVPGAKGGPGRPKHSGLARFIREKTNDLEGQIDEMIRISLDRKHRLQVDAIKWLTERSFGKAPEIAAFAELDNNEAQAAIKALTTVQLEALALSALSVVKCATDQRNATDAPKQEAA